MYRPLFRLLLVATFFTGLAGAATANRFAVSQPRITEATLIKYRRRAFTNPFVNLYRGPFNATIESVYDADTVNVLVYPWPSIAVHTKVRLRGIDTPEKRRYKCPGEKALAKQATDYVKSVLPVGKRVQVSDVSFGKYAGRVIGNVMIESPGDKWTSLSDTLLAAGYAKPYQGGKKEEWCS